MAKIPSYLDMKANNGMIILKEIPTTGIAVSNDHLAFGEVVSIGDVLTIEYNPWPFKKGNRVLFDKHKGFIVEGLWHLEAKTVLSYDDNK